MPEQHQKAVPVSEEARGWPPALPADAHGHDMAMLPRYAELHCVSNFSFQRGASHPEELVRRAYDLGYEALALTDECSVAGVVRAWSGWRAYRAFAQRLEAQGQGRRVREFRLLYGSEFDLGEGRLVALARDLEGWGGLCEFITAARNAGAPKGRYRVDWERSDFTLLRGCEILYAPQRHALHPSLSQVQQTESVRPASPCDVLSSQWPPAPWMQRLDELKQRFGAHLWLAVELPQLIDDDLWLAQLRAAGKRAGVPLVAAGDVHMHVRSRKPLQDVLTALRQGCTVAEAGWHLQPNAQRHLRPRLRLAREYPPDLLAATLAVADRCRFALESIRYDYPQETVPAGLTPTEGLRQLVLAGLRQRYPAARHPHGAPVRIRRWLVKELRLIALCRYEMFFLTVHDVVRFARERGILCQGRGSAANSVVCWCLGITAADPEHSHPLLERFISIDRRDEPPDIDVDFEHERREEVIQYIYAKYGRDRAAIAAVVIAYRTRSAIREVGRALGIPAPLVDAFARDHHGFDAGLTTERLHAWVQRADDVVSPRVLAKWLELTTALMGFPRHLSQHVGGFVLTHTRLTRLVPVEAASMPGRSVIQWDKDDLEALGLMKVDVLALGMLSAIRRCLTLVGQRRGVPFSVYDIPDEDPATYEMIRRADTVGVFQIESRAQMSMLPRLKPATFYDLVVEVAIVRPGPITGGMVHPYLKARERRARGLPITYERSAHERPDEVPRLARALARTLGVPIFQEQVMEISMIAAGFSATEADALRRAMAAWKRKGGVDKFRQRLIEGMRANGYTQQFAERIFRQIEGFGDYGFPESHAYSFALLAYQSSWLKCHEPEAFLAALLNSQPMGFYAPSQLVQDAQRHGVQVLPPDVTQSDWDCTLENSGSKNLGSDSNFPDFGAVAPSPSAHPAASCTAPPATRPAVRLGLRLVGGLSEAGARRLVQARAQTAFASVEDLSLRAQLDVRDLDALAAADALRALAGHRRQQVWEAAARLRAPALLQSAPIVEPPLVLAPAGEGEEIVFDYAALGLTLRRHPLALLRARLARTGLASARELAALAHGRLAAACGIVIGRQQPGTAKGTLFVTLEDETGVVNVIVWKHVRERQREALLGARLLAVHGVWERAGDGGGRVCHLIAQRLEDLTPLLGALARQPSPSRDFH